MKLRKGFPENIRNIIFDLGNVLIDLDIPRSIDAFTALEIKNLDIRDIHPHQKGFFLEYELGHLSDAEFIPRMRQDYDCDNLTDEQLWEAWNTLLPSIDMRRFELLEDLRTGYKLFLLSNSNAGHMACVKKRFFETSGGKEFDSYFEKSFYSHEIHLRKPDPELFRRVLKEAGIAGEETLFIDDNDCNFSGAIDLGINTYHLTGGEKIFALFE